MQSLLEAVAIVLVVSFLALGWRSGLVVALTIPLVLLATFMFMRILNIDLHRISTGALIIALGLLVDDAMIAVEMMARRIDEGFDKFAAATFAYTTTAFPMLTGTLITAAGFLPIALARSATGEYTIALFQVTSIALLISWVAAIVATPLLGYWILKDSKSATKHEVFDTRFYRTLRGVIDWCLAHRWITIVSTIALFAAGVFGMGLTEKQFFPTSDRTEVLVEMWLPEGSSFEATRIEVERLEKMLAKDKDVGQFVAFIGNSPPRYYLSLNQELFRPNFASFLLLTPDIKARDRVVDRIRADFASVFPGVRARAITTPLGPPVAYPVQFRIQGPELAKLKTIAAQVAEVVRQNPNTVETNLDWGDRSPALSVEVDQDKARALGVSSTAVSRTLAGSVNGATIGQFRERDRLIDVVVRAPVDERLNLTKIRELPIMTASGKSVPLTQVASVQLRMEEPIIWRNSRVPTLTVRADIIDGVQAPDVSAQIDPKLGEIRKSLPPGYRIEVGGAFEENAKAQGSINTGMPLMLGVVIGILMLQLQSFSRVAMVLLTAPFGIVGVALGLLAFQRPFGFVAMLGTIALAGMIMRNTVILVEQIKRDLDTGAPPWIAIREATVRRFRPIVLTAAAAILAMVPLSRDILWGPMAVAIMGGLIVATLLTILAVPAIYAAWYRVQRDTVSKVTAVTGDEAGGLVQAMA
jgi:multidrug efflux pump